MSIHGKPVSEITVGDLEELLEERVRENVLLEYKRGAVSNDEWLKKISGLANTYGGHIVYGAAEKGGGEITGLPGVKGEENLKQRLTDLCYTKLRPIIRPEVSSAIPSVQVPGNHCYVIYVDASLEAPHFVLPRGGIWIRTDERSQRVNTELANVEEIGYLTERRRAAVERKNFLLNRARKRLSMRTRQEYNLDKFHDGSPQKTTLEVFVCPTFPTAPTVSHDRQIELLVKNRVQGSRGKFPLARLVETQQDSTIGTSPCMEFSHIEVGAWGNIFFAVEIEINSQNMAGESRQGMSLECLMGHLLVSLRFAARVYREIGFDGGLDVHAYIRGARGKPWLESDADGTLDGGTSTMDDQVEAWTDSSGPRLSRNTDKIGAILARSLLYSSNWRELAQEPGVLTRLRNIGYEYNRWQRASDTLEDDDPE